MISLNSKNRFKPRRYGGVLSLTAITTAVSSALMVGCFHDGDSSKSSELLAAVEHPLPIEVMGTSLRCDPANLAPISTIAAGLAVATPDSIQAINISKDEVNESELNPNAGNNLKRMVPVVAAQTPEGGLIADVDPVRPLLVSYAEQVVGGYELGDGSADIGDPTHLDNIFTSLSLDNGATWKKVAVGETAGKSSTIVTWDGERIAYPGHSHKPTMGIEGNKILVAWNDKYCPSGNPFDLEDPATEDYFQVNGNQGSIDYEGIVAPNGKMLYEVPFSCVWTARGIFGDPEGDGTHAIEWRQAQQMTSGTRDSNKIWIAAEDVGFALAWQEDTEGLRSGKGLGPGEGYSGATTNHGTDIWYTHITMDDFDDVCTDADCTASTDDPLQIAGLATKAKPAVNYAYPVRVTNNAPCSAADNKLYCADFCAATVAVETGNQSGTMIERCVDSDPDYMTPDSTIAPAASVLNGDTGASRPALKIIRTNADVPEYVAVLAYEETKGLSESDPQDQDQGVSTTDIALEGKAVYFESFFWDQPAVVSSGRLVNLRVPEVSMTEDADGNIIDAVPTGLDIYENARRVVIISQVDTCQMGDGDYTFGLMYKQGFETQGGPSDMYIRMNTGFTYDEFEATATNVSARETVYDADGKVTSVSWDVTDLADQSYDNPFDNTFSPRAFLRGNDIYTGFEYTPNWRQTSQGTTPNNFWIHRYVDSAWQGPRQISAVHGPKVSTLDPRFITTPEGWNSGLASDQSNPNVLFMSYGTFDMETGLELDLYYTRSTDRGATWEYLDGDGNAVLAAGIDGIDGTADDAYRLAKLASRMDVEEKEVQAMASPDGTMLFNAWLQETEHYDENSPDSGLESRYGLVKYDFDPAAVP